MPPSVGRQFGRYQLQERLGAGGMGEVYRARDLDLGRDVAIKLLPDRFAADTDRLARFAQEARAASALNHPNIVTIHEVGHADGAPFLVMEYVEGETLRRVIQAGPLSPRRVLDIGVQLADGLAKAHAAGIVHRDLKPENLMVTPDGYLKILDFGLAKLYQPEAGDAGAGDAVTATAPHGLSPGGLTGGAIVGSPGYMSPEQASGRPVDFRSDQFTVGAILYEMITARRAFQRETPVQTLSATIEAEPEPLVARSPTFPAPARWLVERCLAKDPRQRYASTADLAHELHNVRDHLSEVTTGVAAAAPRLSRLRRAWAGLAVAAALLVGVLAVPAVRNAILGPAPPLPLPAEKRIAVLPFQCANDSEDDRLLCDGLLSYVTARLAHLDRVQRAAWVVPAVEVRQAGVTSAATARRALGVTLVVDGRLQRLDGRLVLHATLVDAERLLPLRTTTTEISAGSASVLQDTASAVVALLDLERGPALTAALQAGGTTVPEASTAYADALGYTPYRQARTALERYEQQQNVERAISFFHEALRRDPQYALAHAGLGEAYWRLARFTRKDEHVLLAEEHCRRALDLDATLAEVWITLGTVHAGSGKAAQAVEDLQRALDRDPRNADAYRELAAAYRRLNREADAEATYRKALDLQLNSWITRSAFGGYLVSRGRAPEAEQQYREALRSVPDNARVWSALGSAYYLQEKYAEATTAWQRSLALYPTATAAANLGVRPFYEGRYAEAARQFERAVQLDDRDYRVWRNLASAYYWSPDLRPRAAEAYRRAAALAERERALDPADARVLADLADCYAMLDDPTRARAAAAAAARLGATQGQIARTLAGTYEQLGDRARALEWAAVAVRRGVPRDEIERDPALAALRSDARFAKLP